MMRFLLFALPALALAGPAPLIKDVSGLSSLSRRQSSPSCPANSPVSCSAQAEDGTADSCCVNTPGCAFLQTQFWEVNSGPTNSFTLHGVWPDKADGSFDAFCDPARQYTNITEILQAVGAQDTLDYANQYWLDQNGDNESFWDHEWGKHGTCVSTLVPSCYGADYVPQEEVVQYMQRAVSLFQTNPTYDWLVAAGITPDGNYALADLQAVAQQNHGGQAVWNCKHGVLHEVWYGFNVQGNYESGTFIPSDALGTSSCPDQGISWPSKNGGGQ